MICGNMHNKSTVIHLWLTLINEKQEKAMPIVLTVVSHFSLTLNMIQEVILSVRHPCGICWCRVFHFFFGGHERVAPL